MTKPKDFKKWDELEEKRKLKDKNEVYNHWTHVENNIDDMTKHIMEDHQNLYKSLCGKVLSFRRCNECGISKPNFTYRRFSGVDSRYWNLFKWFGSGTKPITQMLEEDWCPICLEKWVESELKELQQRDDIHKMF